MWPNSAATVLIGVDDGLLAGHVAADRCGRTALAHLALGGFRRLVEPATSAALSVRVDNRRADSRGAASPAATLSAGEKSRPAWDIMPSPFMRPLSAQCTARLRDGSAAGVATVDGQGYARDHGRGVAEEEHDGSGDLGLGRPSSQRHLLQEGPPMSSRPQYHADMGVMTTVGLTALTRMLYLPSSKADTRVMPSRAAFEAPYEMCPGSATRLACLRR